MTAGRIAAVLTCHNLGRWLRDALASVERQTRPPAEILIVDDASTDLFTRQLLARLASDGMGIVHGDGRGASAARNLGAAHTTSEYLVWLDADDTLEPRYFETAAAALDDDNALDFVTCAKRAFGAASYVWTPSRPVFVDAVATGGVPHASTMLRRELWTRAGGFDETLPTFELLDFWATALERGAHGIVLDEPFLNYRVRPGSGYRRSIQPEVYAERLRHFYAKHRAAVERDGLDLVLGKEAFVQSQRAHRQMLESRAVALEGELAALHASIAEAARALEARGSSRVRWADLDGERPLSAHAGRDRGTPIDRYYVDRFLARFEQDTRGRVFDASASDLRAAADVASSSYDCVVLRHTLRHVGDPGTALSECVRMLRPGGVLLATLPVVARADDEAERDGDVWRFTEASARTLLAGALPLDAFELTSFGNLKACTALLQGLSAEEMSPPDLDRVDPAFPVMIAIHAVKPRASSVASGFSTAVASAKAVSRTSSPAAILAYHRIASLSPDSHALCTPPDVFRDHMAFIRRECTPMALDDLVRAAASGTIPERAVAVTLDDGYLDHLTAASPVLEEQGVPATFFVNSDRLDEEHERWWDILERVFLCQPALPATLWVRAGSHDVDRPTSTMAERAAALESLNRAAWPLDDGARRQLVADVLAWSGATPCTRPSHRVLTAVEIRMLADRAGHTIGAHTVNHLALTCHAADVKRREIADDKSTLERVVGRPIELFSYPYGELDGETVAAVRDAGFRAAVTVEAGRVAAGGNRLLLPRIEVANGAPAAFARRMRELFA